MFCNLHKGSNFTPGVGRCGSCGGSTSSSGVKICVTCSAAKKQCQVCRVPLNIAPKDGK
ncbi:MAG: hypothetical protein K2W95_29905 [Candidatus Obscuribacterales bacterium]|nr:hypothetical protein [Candidatus Obscuribacterales bacterium]